MVTTTLAKIGFFAGKSPTLIMLLAKFMVEISFYVHKNFGKT